MDIKRQSRIQLYHGPGSFNPRVGIVKKKNQKKTYSKIFGDWLCDAAGSNKNIVAIRQQ